jgi:uncharacterized membrane protein YtjA (UPF0391 family)
VENVSASAATAAKVIFLMIVIPFMASAFDTPADAFSAVNRIRRQ